jgi:hypothetical protein
LVEADEVALAKSCISHNPTFSARPTASQAMPAPFIPPPTTKRSSGASPLPFMATGYSALDRRMQGPQMAAWGFCSRSSCSASPFMPCGRPFPAGRACTTGSSASPTNLHGPRRHHRRRPRLRPCRPARSRSRRPSSARAAGPIIPPVLKNAVSAAVHSQRPQLGLTPVGVVDRGGGATYFAAPQQRP